MAYGWISPTGNYIPLPVKSYPDLQGQLVSDYARDKKRFGVNRYCKIVPVDRNTGRYRRFLPEARGQVSDASNSRFVWNPGADAPQGNTNGQPSELQMWQTTRWAYPDTVSHEEENFADWNLKAQTVSKEVQMAMTWRTYAANVAMVNTANYPASNFSTLLGALGGAVYLSGATMANKLIEQMVSHAKRAIAKATMGMVEQDSLVMVMNPTTASALARTEEISTFRAQQVSSPKIQQYEGINDTWGLPPILYGVNVEVEQAIYTGIQGFPSLTDTAAYNDYTFPDNKIWIGARPGELVGELNNLDVLSYFMLEELTVESQDWPWHRRTDYRVVEQWAFGVTSPRAGYVFTNVLLP